MNHVFKIVRYYYPYYYPTTDPSSPYYLDPSSRAIGGFIAGGIFFIGAIIAFVAHCSAMKNDSAYKKSEKLGLKIAGFMFSFAMVFFLLAITNIANPV